jgi:hypothetical protein
VLISLLLFVLGSPAFIIAVKMLALSAQTLLDSLQSKELLVAVTEPLYIHYWLAKRTESPPLFN